MAEQLRDIIKKRIPFLYEALGRLHRYLFDPPRKRQTRTLDQLRVFAGARSP